MTKASDEFEIMIARIHELLEGEDASVEWNEKIPDPDNPEQMRQVDVLIRKNGFISLIECRLHKEPQNVKWIEELIGRRISLDASAIIAVSSSGFTSGAIKKAAKYGIILQDMQSLSDKEIQSWSKSAEVSIFFYRYENFRLSLFFNINDASAIDKDQLQKELLHYHGFRSLFTAQLEPLDSKRLIVIQNRKQSVKFRVNFKIDGFMLCGFEVLEIQSVGRAFLEEVKLHVPEVLAYGSPLLDNSKRNVFIQKFNLGDTRIVHHEGHVSISLDLSKLEVPPYWQFRFVDISCQQENYHDVFEIISPENIIMKVDKLHLAIVGIREKE